ncbi:GNAT family N-acetyltransferase [Roseitranquillus sediminis]|uniref:GNAT family N-acetyltransferase n=1 Tax=Roseitranquillus sediminis TaxID=2809051 RepID=UPI001D0C88EB|nr:GNAT family N-acetyltransferase [Roseitranquillus sediminis]MBM9593203.1 GNAT family N-acetyltransferase [Roseitranquillus sediminis]
MTPPDFATLMRVTAATWPPVRTWHDGGWTRRDGGGGGGRVSSATADGAVEVRPDSPPLVMVRPGEEALDTALAAAGYAVKDPTRMMVGEARALAARIKPATGWTASHRIGAMEEIWRTGGLSPARWAVMDRAADPRAWMLARLGERPAGAAFASVAEGVAMLHAIEVLPDARRAGVGLRLLHLAANWALRHDARWIALAVTRANVAANALYEQAGLVETAGYHYRIREAP